LIYILLCGCIYMQKRSLKNYMEKSVSMDVLTEE
jgi:hypothetical protein